MSNPQQYTSSFTSVPSQAPSTNTTTTSTASFTYNPHHNPHQLHHSHASSLPHQFTTPNPSNTNPSYYLAGNGRGLQTQSTQNNEFTSMMLGSSFTPHHYSTPTPSTVPSNTVNSNNNTNSTTVGNTMPMTSSQFTTLQQPQYATSNSNQFSVGPHQVMDALIQQYNGGNTASHSTGVFMPGTTSPSPSANPVTTVTANPSQFMNTSMNPQGANPSSTPNSATYGMLLNMPQSTNSMDTGLLQGSQSTTGMMAGTMNGTSTPTPTSMMTGNAANNGTAGANNMRRFSVEQIKLVQQLIEHCLKSYLSKTETITYLCGRYSHIEPGFINLTWQKLEQQNPAFFRAYNIRLRIKDQINQFNDIVNYQALLMQYHQANEMSPMSASGANGIPVNPSGPGTPVNILQHGDVMMTNQQQQQHIPQSAMHNTSHGANMQIPQAPPISSFNTFNGNMPQQQQPLQQTTVGQQQQPSQHQAQHMMQAQQQQQQQQQQQTHQSIITNNSGNNVSNSNSSQAPSNVVSNKSNKNSSSNSVTEQPSEDKKKRKKNSPKATSPKKKRKTESDDEFVPIPSADSEDSTIDDSEFSHVQPELSTDPLAANPIIGSIFDDPFDTFVEYSDYFLNNNNQDGE